MPKKVPHHLLYLFLLLMFLFTDEVSSNYILSSFSKFSPVSELILYVTFLIIVIFISPIQAGFSDLYCRKKSIISSLIFSCLSILMILFSSYFHYSILSLSMIILFKGALGNTLPLSLAGVADTQLSNTRFSMALCTGAMAAGYLGLILAKKFTGTINTGIILIGLFIIVIIFCILFFEDLRDKEGETILAKSNESKVQLLLREIKLVLGEFKLVKIELSCSRTRYGLVTFLMWEIAQYSIHMLNVDLQIKKFSNLTTAMVVGYLVGLAFLRLSKNIYDKNVIRIGYVVCLSSIIPYILSYWYLENIKSVLLVCYFFYNLGNVFLAPSLFSILAQERKPHEQGKIFGLLESTDTVAFLTASIFAISYNTLGLPTIYIVGFSTLVLSSSWIFLKLFEKKKRKI